MDSCSAGPWHRSARYETGQPRKHVLGVVGQDSTVWERSLEAVRRPWPNQRRQLCLLMVSWLCAFGAQAVMATTGSAQNLTVSASAPPFIQGLLPKQSVNDFSCGLSSLLRIRCGCHRRRRLEPWEFTSTCTAELSASVVVATVHPHIARRRLLVPCPRLDEGHVFHECCRTVG